MNKQFNKPKGFGEILDHTFRLSKNHFKDFMKIFLILIGPIYLFQAVVELFGGRSFVRDVDSGNQWFEQILANFDQTEVVSQSFGVDLWLILLGLISFLLFPVAQAAILFAVNQIKKGEDFTVSSVIRRAFSRFWPMIGSGILFFMIMIVIIFVPVIAMAVVTANAIGSASNIGATILLSILVGIGLLVAIPLLLTRLSFYFGSAVIDENSPGFIRSWKLTKKRTWFLFGLYVVLSLIIGAISVAIEASFGAVLGNSVLFVLVNNLALLVTTMIFSVGYAVMFLDLKTRDSADDIVDMLNDYSEGKVD